MIDFFLTFGAVAILDILWVFYVDAIKDYKAAQSASLATLIYILSGVAIISYTSNPINLIGAVIGAFVGTYIAVLITKRRSKK